MVTFDIGSPQEERLEPGKGQQGTSSEDALNLIRQEGKSGVEQGEIILDTINNAVGPLTPDLVYKSLVRDYKAAERIMGERFIRRIAGYSPHYVEKNLHIPEFLREIKKNIESSIDELRKKGLIDDGGNVSEKGVDVGALTLYMEELKNLIPQGVTGKRLHRKRSPSGEREELKSFRGERFRDLSMRGSLKVALRRGRDHLRVEDLRAQTRKSRGECCVIYAMDSSASMRGEKLAMSKKAGVALAYHATEQLDKVGLLVFGSEIKEKIDPTRDFMAIVRGMTTVRAMNETNISQTVREATSMFPSTDVTKHLVLITDALPTVGDDPVGSTLSAVSQARTYGITISVIGIGLDDEGTGLARKISEIGDGRLYITKTVSDLDAIVLEDYHRATNRMA